jgi:hypothetical protein
MAFKGIEERFLAKVERLYDQGSTRDIGLSHVRGDQPFLELKPDDPNKNETKHDSFALPIGSIKRDVIRVGKFLTSGNGLLFLLKQQALQTGNEFVENRVLNPLFVIGNVQPYKHFSRGLASAKDFDLAGEPLTDHYGNKKPASDSSIGSAGRLQKHTGDDAIARVTGNSPSLLSLLSGRAISKIIGNTFSVGKAGSYGIDDRPEFNVNGELYSIATWKGVKKASGPISNINRAQANLRVGDIRGAITNIKNAFNQLRNGTTSSTKVTLNDYFITDNINGADRYLKDSIVDGKISTSYLQHPVTDTRTPIAPPTDYTAESSKTVQERSNDISRKIASTSVSIKTGIPSSDAAFSTVATFLNSRRTQSFPNFITTSDKAVEFDHLLYPASSLRTRFNDDANNRIGDMKKIFADRQTKQFDYWDLRKNITGIEYTSVQAGAPLDPTTLPSKAGGYMTDKMNLHGVFDNPVDATQTSLKTLNDIRAVGGKDLIDVQWFDFVNKKTIPFRAYVTNIVESVNPQTSDTPYIGRIERNIVYAGVSRELSLQLRIHALSEQELTKVWDKINYMTGLCFPSKFVAGFMVPPFVKLTIGDVYRDQPGYIRSLTHTIEDNTPWEITSGAQVPHGILMNITFSIIEKRQMTTSSTFYPLNSRGITANFSGI